MTLSGSAPPPVAAPGLFKTLWSLATGAPPCGVVLARESGQVLAWDENHWLYLLNSRGERQGQARPLSALAAACLADDGSALGVAGARGEVGRLAPDLTPRWQRTLRHPAVAVAVDPFARRLAVSDSKGGLFVFDRDGRLLWEAHQPRPLHHLAFVPEAPFLLGAADFGLVVSLEAATGQLVWRDGLAAHCGGLASSGDGQCIVLGVDGQTIGGYPKIAQVIQADLDRLGQLRPGERIRFVRVKLDEAITLQRQRLAELNGWGVRLRATS